MPFHQAKNSLKKNATSRRAVVDGIEYLVAPVVMIVDGVLNDALVTHEEYGKYIEAWNGRPVPVMHPESPDGEPLSANSPEQAAKVNIGVIYNARVDDNKLKAEVWIDVAKAKRLGFGKLVAAIQAGEVVEVSTGYYSDSDMTPGVYNGIPYSEIHRNIRPDHLALLPGEIGACSVDDGCGLRDNKRRGVGMKINSAFAALAKALGIKINIQEDKDMDDKALLAGAKKLHANGKLTAKQLENLQEMSPEERKLISALIQALDDMPGGEEEEIIDDPASVVVEEEEEPPSTMEEGKDGQLSANARKAAAAKKAAAKGIVAMSQADIDKLIANKVSDAIRRTELTQRLVANERCPFEEADLKTMSIAHLEKLEKSIRPQDYSGAGGFATNSNEFDQEAKPLTIHRGLLAKDKQEAQA